MSSRIYNLVIVAMMLIPVFSLSEELPNMKKAAEIATDILYIEVVDFYGSSYIEADISRILKGSYNNKVWVDRSIDEGDKYPFIVGERYILFLRETIGDTFKIIGPDVDWAVHIIDESGNIDFTTFVDINGTLTLDETADLINSYIDPFYNKDEE